MAPKIPGRITPIPGMYFQRQKHNMPNIPSGDLKISREWCFHKGNVGTLHFRIFEIWFSTGIFTMQVWAFLPKLLSAWLALMKIGFDNFIALKIDKTKIN